MMGVRDMDRSLDLVTVPPARPARGAWRLEVADGVLDLGVAGNQGPAAADDLGADAQRAGKVVRNAAAGPGPDGGGHGGGTGAGPAHDRAMGVGLWGGRASGTDIRADRRFPPALDQTRQEELKAAVQQTPAASGIELANWCWQVVRQFAAEGFGITLSRSSCLNYLHRLGFSFKRPKKRLLKANETLREAFVAEYGALMEEAQRTGAKVFFADAAHFRADAELRGKWVLKGEPALVDSTSPRYGAQASYYSAVCLETGEVEWMQLAGNSNSATSAAFLEQLRERHDGRLNVIWDNAPAHRGEAVRGLLRKPGLNLRLINLPGYSPDFNSDEAIWGWAREETTGNLCLGGKAAVQERIGGCLAGLAGRKEEVRDVAGPSCNQGPKHSCGTPSPIPEVPQMHLPPWLWFRPIIHWS